MQANQRRRHGHAAVAGGGWIAEGEGVGLGLAYKAGKVDWGRRWPICILKWA